VAAGLGAVARGGKASAKRRADVKLDRFGTVYAFGKQRLTTNVLAFELTAFVLMAAVIGVVILVGRQKA